MSEPKHFWLYTADVLFTVGNEDIKTVQTNGLIVTDADKQYVNRSSLDNAIGFANHRLMNDSPFDSKDIKVVDIIFTNLSYLGLMTDEQFQPTQVMRTEAEVKQAFNQNNNPTEL